MVLPSGLKLLLNMSEDKKKWLGLGKDSNCRCLEFYTDLTQLCDTCPLKTLIPEGIQFQIVAEAEDNRELMPPNQFKQWIEGQISAATAVMQQMRIDAMHPAEHYPNVLTEHFIWNKERAKALRRFMLNEILETEAAQIIAEAEGKAARLFEDWQSRKRYTLEEGNPQVLADLRRRHIQHHERTFIPYLDFEGATRLQLLSRLKFILREVKAGRDTRTNPAHLTNRLAHRMTNARIITYLGGLVKEPEPRKAEPERLPEFTELFFNEANADKVRGLMPPNLRYYQAVCFAMATALKEKQYCPKYSKEVIARVLAAEFYGGTYPEVFRASKYTKAHAFLDHRRQFYSQL